MGPWEVSAVVSDRGIDLPDWSLHARLWRFCLPRRVKHLRVTSLIVDIAKESEG